MIQKTEILDHSEGGRSISGRRVGVARYLAPKSKNPMGKYQQDGMNIG